MGWILTFSLVFTLLNTAFSKDYKDETPKYCDFIVVGSGAGGSIVAARLSEIPTVTVCLIEAGIKETQGQYQSALSIPRLTASLPGDYTWNTTTVPQSNLNGRKLFNGMGKALGGSTSHNGMSYFRGFKADYDYWEKIGAKGWNYKTVLPYFLKSENITVDELRNSPLHGTGGPLTVSQDPTSLTIPLGQLWKRAAKELYIPIVDCAGPSPFGVCVTQTIIKDGKRESTASAFLVPAMGRRNLFVVTEALVSKILIQGKKTYGIRYIQHGRTYTIKARREVILSGGSLESPKLLQLSGIGSKKVLKHLNVRPNAFLPVGENLQDHLMLPIDILSNIDTVTLEDLKDSNVMAEYLFKRTGVWSSNRIPFNVFIGGLSKHKQNWPDIQIMVFDGLIEDAPSSSDVRAGRFPEPRSGYLKQRKGYSILIFLSHTKSRGTIRARSQNPDDTPLIDPRYFSNKDDLEDLVKGIRAIQKILKNSAAMREVKARLTPRPPGYFNQESAEQCYTTTKVDSDEFWKCVIRQQLNVGLHPVRSCPMGSPNDRWAVVDPKLRVYGIKGLRVVDASIMPEVSSTNLMGPTIMIGEYAADMIKKDHKLGNY